MLRVKIFSSATDHRDINQLEDEINRWLENTHPVIRQMTQTNSEGRIAVTFLYDGGQRDAHAHTTSAEAPEAPEAFENNLYDSELTPTDDEPGLLPEAELPY